MEHFMYDIQGRKKIKYENDFSFFIFHHRDILTIRSIEHEIQITFMNLQERYFRILF